MKKYRKLCSLIGFSIMLACSDGFSMINKAKTVRKGMTVTEVKALLGEPKKIRPGYVDPSKTMFLYGTGTAASTDVEIYFDKDVDTVTRLILPKGHND